MGDRVSFEVSITMSPDEEDFGLSEEEHTGFVPVVVAHSADEAEQYCELLSDHDIPAMIGDNEPETDADKETPANPRPRISRGVSVMVPEALLDEASGVIADREDLDEFRVDDDDDESDDDDELGLEEESATDAGEEPDSGEDLFFENDDEPP